ncbi:hypothetical protein WH52_11050 [Tenacibaculum holothuriorum]|uniref:RiboL-PSP-HEPN domain-containing protein n=1 Tax=Tenacibaculum holothuriorum TaxID=1635173 RepID=A0A1Y2PBN6_9FLAO|nr:hypothetical protein [Tenacibaculum holothuriorum]OSY87411.1 hypothetical protein WH52_11050 [Tenacibaculum holothuriorum]
MEKKYFGRNRFIGLPINKESMSYIRSSLDVYTFDSYVVGSNDEAQYMIDLFHESLKDNPKKEWYSNQEGVYLPIEAELNSLKKQLLIVSEIQIMFTYKQFESCLKNLIKTFYPAKASGNIYKWRNLLEFFKDKELDLKKLCGYNDVNELRVVNNAIKHNLEAYGRSTKLIPELSKYSQEGVTGVQLANFYRRVKFAVPIFYSLICDFVEEDVLG